MENHGLNQEIYLEPNPDGDSYEIIGSDVEVHTCRIYERTRDSSKVRSRAIIDYRWETKVYDGRLVAVHKDGEYLAYVLHSRNSCSVRVINRNTKSRALIKTFVGQAVDLVWSFSSSPLLLAISDEAGNIIIHAVEDREAEMILTKYLRVERSSSVVARQPPHRLAWCPFIPDNSGYSDHSTAGSDDEQCRLLAIYHGCQVDILNIDKIIKHYGNETSFAVAETGIMSKDIDSDITAVAIAPDATALALSSQNGDVMFYILESDGTIKAAQTWKPHKGRRKEVTSIVFLDNFLAAGQSEDTYWKYVLTASEGNRELKLWSCENWECLSTLRIDPPEAHLDHTTLLLTSDWTSQYIFLTDIERKSLYTVEIASTLSGRIRFASFTEFPLKHPALSVAVVRAGLRRGLRPPSPDVTTDIEDTSEHDVINMVGVQAFLYVVNPKSLLELDIRFVPPRREDVNESILSTVSSGKFGSLHDEVVDLSSDLQPASVLGSSGVDIRPSPRNSLSFGYDSGLRGRRSTSVHSNSPNNVTPLQELTVEQRISASPSSQEVSKILANPLVPTTSVDAVSCLEDASNVEELDDDRGTPTTESAQLSVSLAELFPTLHQPVNSTMVHDQPQVDILPITPNSTLLADALAKWNSDLTTFSLAIARQEEALQQLKVLIGSQQSMWEAMLRLVQNCERQGSDNAQYLQQCVSALHPDQFHQTITHTLENTVQRTLVSALQSETRHVLLPAMTECLQPVSAGFLADVSRQLSNADAFFRDNITKMMRSKEMVEGIGQAAAKCAVSEAQAAFRDTFQKSTAPAFESAVRGLFTQVNDAFQRGTKEYVDQLNRQSAMIVEEWRKGLVASTDQLKASSDRQFAAIQVNMEKQFGSLSQGLREALFANIRSIVKEEVAKVVADSQQALNDTVMRAIRSQAPTPVPTASVVDRQQVLNEIDGYLKRGQLNAAFQHALLAKDVAIVNNLCQRVEPSRLFAETPCQLQQAVVLSLLQQLTADLATNTELKLRYMQEAVPSLDAKTVSEGSGPTVLRHIHEKLNTFLQSKPGAYSHRGKTVLMLLSSLLTQ